MSEQKYRVIEEAKYGVYVWEMPNGQWIGDDEGNFLCVAAMKGSEVKLKMLREAVQHYGITDGKPVFLSGHRKVTEEEFETQKQRASWGLIPDEYDIPALVSEQIYKERHGT